VLSGIAEAIRYLINGPIELSPEHYRQQTPDGRIYTDAFNFIERTRVRFEEGENGYNLARDQLYIKPPHEFPSYGHYLATAFHEMGHWTGRRLGRPMGMATTDPRHAQEEVIADVCSMHLCYCLHLEELHPDLGHKEYITHWARNFDQRTFARSVDEGMRASKYLRGLGRLADRK
jgi:antirestriction protein ArdC